MQQPDTAEQLAYFYCSRAEENRRDPETILNTLIHQLAQADESKILEPVVDKYKKRQATGQNTSRLTLQESKELLLQLTDIYPQTTICLDALDEVDNEIRIHLLKSLKWIVEKSKNLVKIFATSRNDTDILHQFKIFPRIDVQPDDNANDINNFIKIKVEDAIADAQLLDGEISDVLAVEVYEVLCTRAKGM
jgi:hypothetical protein